MNLAKATLALQQLFGIEEQKPKEIAPAAEQPLNHHTTRHCEMMKLCIQNSLDFLDYYVDQLTFLHEHKTRSSLNLRQRRTRLSIADFDIVKQIGQGGYGQVFLSRKRDTKEMCALKKMNKKMLQNMGEIEHILTERDVLLVSNSPWLVKLLYSFQDVQHVYLAMEYVPGGDFRTLLNASGVLVEDHARFYFGEMCSAVFDLHRLGYIHRDLKPENFLLDATGHVKLTDFGLSRGSVSKECIDLLRKKLEMVKKETLDVQTVNQRFNTYQTMHKEHRAFTLVGSPDYMAPEVLTGTDHGYDSAVDYWSLGCILFEALAGFPPFTAQTIEKVWVNLYNWEKVLERPVYEGADEEFNLSDNAWDLISKLICKYDQRIKNPTTLQQQKFFNGIEFENFRVPGCFTVPLIPILRDDQDTAYFDDFSNPKDMALYGEIKKKEQQMAQELEGMNVLQSAFCGFTFQHRKPHVTQV